MRFAFTAGAALVATGVAAGAFGAHGLKAVLAPDRLALWETAVRYAWVGGLGLMICGLGAALGPSRTWAPAAWSLLAGVLVFSGTVGALALGAPRWLGAVTPVGGAALIVGFLLAAAAGAQSRRAG